VRGRRLRRKSLSKRKRRSQHDCWRKIYLATLPCKRFPFPPCPPALILTGGAKKQRWFGKYFFARLLHPPPFNIKAGGGGGERDPLEEGRWLNIFSTNRPGLINCKLKKVSLLLPLVRHPELPWHGFKCGICLRKHLFHITAT
jgi:hypothetical protein